MDILLGIGLFIVNHPAELSGILLPFIVRWLSKDVHNEEERQIVSVLVCVATALAFKWRLLVYGSPEQFAATLTLIFFECNNVYNLYFKKSMFNAPPAPVIQPIGLAEVGTP